MPNPRVRLPPSESPANPYFANYVTDQLVTRFGPQEVFGGGLRVTTTIDPGLQKLARAGDREGAACLDRADRRARHDRRPHRRRARDGRRAQLHQSQFNLATQGERQPGSAFKPFVLAAALRSGISPSTTLVSAPVTIDAGGRLWSVNNFEHESLGPIDLSTRSPYSDNTVFAQLTNIVGPANVVEGRADDGHHDAAPAVLLDRARRRARDAARDGARLRVARRRRLPARQLALRQRAAPVRASPTPNGKTVTQTAPSSFRLRSTASPERNAAIEDQLLQGVVQLRHRAPPPQLPGWQIAGKTGTTENYGDAWFVGFTPDLVTAVWVGYPNKLVPMLTEFHGHPSRAEPFRR